MNRSAIAVVAASAVMPVRCVDHAGDYTRRSMPMETAFRSEERFTKAEFFEWLESRPRGDVHRYELLDGQVVMSPPSRSGHGSVGFKIVTALGDYLRTTAAGGDMIRAPATSCQAATCSSRMSRSFLRLRSRAVQSPIPTRS